MSRRITKKALAAYREQLKQEFPKLRFVDKQDDSFSCVLAAVVRAVTFGGQSRYMTHYVTTIGNTIYFPEGWYRRSPGARYLVLRHEAVHLRQFRRLGLVLMTLIYVFPILPLGLAAGRAWLEWEAYEETLRATAEVYGVDAARSQRARIVDQFVSGAYGWMWPFRRQVENWVDVVLEKLAAHHVELD